MADNISQNPPKTSSSSRSGHSIVHLPGHHHHHHHRHNKSNEDPRALRPSISREESISSFKDRGAAAAAAAAMYNSRSRAQSPTPSGHSVSAYVKGGSFDGQTSPGHHKKGILGRLRRNKDKDEGAPALQRKMSPSQHNLSAKPSRPGLIRP